MADEIKSLMLHFDDLPHHDTLKWLTDLELRRRRYPDPCSSKSGKSWKRYDKPTAMLIGN
ncbi:MAG: hypothetical protein R2822_26575 [Spirosomataceae bacterium]